jgi:hypothetical protein
MEANNPARVASGRVCGFDLLAVRADPYPHVVCEGFLDPGLYHELCRTFPVCPPGKSPTGFALYWGEDGYDRLLDEQPSWRALHDTFQSQSFIDWGARQFAEVWEREGCRIDPAAARYVAHREVRADKERTSLGLAAYGSHELWVRMDIHQGHVGYSMREHVDHARRLISMLIYCCDHDEHQMSGGDLLLHDPSLERQAPMRIEPRHNLMVAFPCIKDSLHSVAKLRAATSTRNYVHVFISSSADIWPRHPAPPLWRKALSSIEHRLADLR